MLPDERKRQIVSLVTERGGSTVEELTSEFDVSAATVRRDLSDLEADGLIERSHGGALPVTGVAEEPRYSHRQVENLAAKAAIGARAAEEIEPGQVVYFDGGTTTVEVAKSVPAREDFIAVTNSLPLVFELESASCQIKVTGGAFRERTRTLVGPTGEAFLERINLDLLFLGTNDVELGEGLFTPDEDEGQMKRLMTERAETVVLVADETKLDERSFVRFADMDVVDLFVTDATFDDEETALLDEAGVSVVSVDVEES